MKHLFYFIGIFFILRQLAFIFSPIESWEKAKKFIDLTKRLKGKEYDDLDPETQRTILAKLPLLILLLWLFVGLFSFNWPAFAAIIVLGFAVGFFAKATSYSRINIVTYFINHFICLIFGVFVILNSYHLKIDLYQWLLSFFN